MRLELTFKNGNTIVLADNSAIEVSGSLYARNKFRVYAPDAGVASFFTYFSDPENLDEMLFIGYADNTDDVLFRQELAHYTIVAEIGRKLFESTNPNTGDKISSYQMYAVIEQPTPIEREEPVPDPETEEIIDILLGREE